MKTVSARRMWFLSVALAAIVTLSAVLFNVVSLPRINHDGLWHETEGRASPIAARASALTGHAPIWIDGDADFTNASGVSWGSGSAEDPYIIEELDINASSADGIRIFNTDAYFVVRNCYIHDGLPDHYGFYLFRCSNGTVLDCTCEKVTSGIFAYLDDNNTIENNTCQNCDEGVRLYLTTSDTLVRNTCVNNALAMIMIHSRDCTIENNNCSGSSGDWGVYMSSSDGMSIDNNTICQTNGDGLTITSSGNITIRNNTCSYNVESGIVLSPASNITISDCLLADNSWYGLAIYETDSADNRIWNNTFYHNRGSGDTYNPSAVQAFDEGSRNWWNSTDGCGNYWSDWISPDDLPPYGIVDVPYVLAGSAGAQDLFPLTTMTEPIPEFSSLPAVVMVMLVAVLLIAGVRRRKT